MRPALAIAAINGTILLAYIAVERDLPFASTRVRLVAFIVVLAIIVSVPAARLVGRRTLDVVASAQLALLSGLMVLVLAELLFRVAPNIFPENLRRLVETESSSAIARERVVELLPHSPYAKPRANTTIHIPGYYGPKDSFVYQWTTDRRGFKNTGAIAALATVDVVALGASFTEGMGVSVEDTWTSKLSKLGYPAYSLGVQGYAPTQYRGAYEHYGRALSPKWVIVDYTDGIYRRNSHFQSARDGEPSSRSLPSAIGRLVERDELEEKRPIYLETKDGYRVPIVLTKHHTFVTSAMVSLVQQTLQFALRFDPKAGTAPDDPRFVSDQALRRSEDSRLQLMARYRSEIANVTTHKLDPVVISQDPLWLSTENEFEKIIKMARQDGANVLFLFLPDRATSYYERATGQSLPTDSYGFIEAALLARFAQQHGVEMLDLGPIFRSYVAKLNDDSPIEQYPFLRVDGHPSAKGHEIIAAEVARFLSTRLSARN